MTGRSREVILGAIVFIALTILVVGTLWLSENYFGPDGGYKLVVRFDSVIGLQRGNPVNLRGVKVGKVLGLTIDDEGYPSVLIGFRNHRDLPADTEVFLKSQGVLGEQSIEVEIGTSNETLADGAAVVGEASAGLEELTVSAATMAIDLKEAVDTLLTDKNVAHIRNTISQMDSTMSAISKLVEVNQATLSEALEKLAATTADAHGIVGENREDIRSSVKRLQEAAVRMASVSEELEQGAGSLRSMIGNVDNLAEGVLRGEGTLGKLVVDESLYLELRSTVSSIDSLVRDVKLNPGRYFNVSVF